jgi:hypothetical protein
MGGLGHEYPTLRQVHDFSTLPRLFFLLKKHDSAFQFLTETVHLSHLADAQGLAKLPTFARLRLGRQVFASHSTQAKEETCSLPHKIKTAFAVNFVGERGVFF